MTDPCESNTEAWIYQSRHQQEFHKQNVILKLKAFRECWRGIEISCVGNRLLRMT